jgi:hypothetical protein
MVGTTYVGTSASVTSMVTGRTIRSISSRAERLRMKRGGVRPSSSDIETPAANSAYLGAQPPGSIGVRRYITAYRVTPYPETKCPVVMIEQEHESFEPWRAAGLRTPLL